MCLVLKSPPKVSPPKVVLKRGLILDLLSGRSLIRDSTVSAVILLMFGVCVCVCMHMHVSEHVCVCVCVCVYAYT